MSARAIAIHGNEMSGERRANLEIKSECPALPNNENCMRLLKRQSQMEFQPLFFLQCLLYTVLKKVTQADLKKNNNRGNQKE